MSEKLDGIRAYWTGEELISRWGKKIESPGWFIEDFPEGIGLDGELWLGREKFEEVTGLLNSSDKVDPLWKDLKYMIFDLPHSNQPYEVRIQELGNMSLPFHMLIVQNSRCEDVNYLIERMNEIVAIGGEGLMMVKPKSLYFQGRTKYLLKLKVKVVSSAHYQSLTPNVKFNF